APAGGISTSSGSIAPARFCRARAGTTTGPPPGRASHAGGRQTLGSELDHPLSLPEAPKAYQGRALGLPGRSRAGGDEGDVVLVRPDRLWNRPGSVGRSGF